MSNATRFITESLGACGFAVLRGQVAYIQRPDFWAHGMDASSDFADKALPAKLNTFIGCKVYFARFAEFESGLVKVLARSDDDLARRIKQITGFTTTQLFLASELEGELDPADVPPRKVISEPNPEGGDVHVGVTTKEGPRICAECEWLTIGRGCSKSAESSIQYPAPNVPRRCKAYRPQFENMDGRNGFVLWPELFQKSI